MALFEEPDVYPVPALDTVELGILESAVACDPSLGQIPRFVLHQLVRVMVTYAPDLAGNPVVCAAWLQTLFQATQVTLASAFTKSFHHMLTAADLLRSH
jgi:hypothetical protein